MSELEDVPPGVDLPRGEADVALAARQLRAAPPSPRAVEIADRVLQRALAAPRRAVLVRAAPPHEHLRVSSVAITAVLQERIDAELVGAAVRRVLLDVTRDERLAGVTIDLVVQYGTSVCEVGDLARVLAEAALADVLGEAWAVGGGTVVVSHAHVSDVTVGDPHLVDPADERG